MNAQLVAENIAAQLERPCLFQTRYEAVHRQNNEVSVPRVSRSGYPAVLAVPRSQEPSSYHEGTIPLQTLRADIDYGFAES